VQSQRPPLTKTMKLTKSQILTDFRLSYLKFSESRIFFNVKYTRCRPFDSPDGGGRTTRPPSPATPLVLPSTWFICSSGSTTTADVGSPHRRYFRT
jgi:hypothetical protein